MQKLPSGVLFRQLKAGGGKSPEANSRCECVCCGTLVDGSVFFNGSTDSSDGRSCTLVPRQLVQVSQALPLSRPAAVTRVRTAGSWRRASGHAGRRSLGNSCAAPTWIRRQQARCALSFGARRMSLELCFRVALQPDPCSLVCENGVTISAWRVLKFDVELVAVGAPQ